MNGRRLPWTLDVAISHRAKNEHALTCLDNTYQDHVMRNSLDAEPHISRRNLLEAWRTAAGPWINTTVLSALFLMSLIQSLTCFAKFLDPPKTSSINLLRLKAEDTPWITVCPVPAFGLQKLAEFLREAQLGSIEDVGFTGEQFSAASKVNKTLERVLSEAGMPLWKHELICSVATNDAHEENCGFFQNGDLGRNGSLVVDDVKLNDPMLAKTRVGTWETELVALDRSSMHLCSTLKLNFSLDPVAMQYVKLTMKLGTEGPPLVEDKLFQKVVDDGKFQPSYAVFLTEPGTKPFTYHFIDDKEQVTGRNIPCRDKVEIRPRVKRFQFLDTPDHPCDKEGSAAAAHHECLTQCFEAKHLGEICRIPGFRSNLSSSLGPQFKPVPVCKLLEDYQLLYSRSASRKAQERNVLTQCERRVCKKPCTVLEYDIMATTMDRVNPSANLSQVWTNCGAKGTTIKIMAGNPYATVIEERFAYDANQLVSDLGGSWGFFLGISIVNVLEWVRAAIRYVMTRV